MGVRVHARIVFVRVCIVGGVFIPFYTKDKHKAKNGLTFRLYMHCRINSFIKVENEKYFTTAIDWGFRIHFSQHFIHSV